MLIIGDIMILKRIAEGIRRLDFLTIFVELVIVVLGVYIGIYIGDAANKRSLQADVDRSLGVLLVQLEEDRVSLGQVIDTQNQAQEAYQTNIDALSTSPADMTSFAIADQQSFTLNRTLFPNRSAYQTIRDMGYLAEIEDAELQLLVANLFERTYMRQDQNALILDNIVAEYQSSIRDMYWDTTGLVFINYSPDGIMRLRNGVRNVKLWSGYYLGILNVEVKPELDNTIDALEVYLQ